MMRDIATMVEQLDETFEWFHEQAQLFHVRPERDVVEDGGDVVCVCDSPFFEACRCRNLPHNGSEKGEPLESVVRASEACCAMEDDGVGLAVVCGGGTCTNLSIAVLMMLEKLRQSVRLLDDFSSPSMLTDVLEQETTGVATATSREHFFAIFWQRQFPAQF